MGYENKGSFGPTVTVSMEPDRSGNYVCNGTADNVDIQLAINEVGRRGGGIVHIKQGAYDIRVKLVNNGYSDVIVEGEGFDTVLTAMNALDDRVIEIGTWGGPVVYNWHFRDFMINGNKANQTNAIAQALRLEWVTRYSVKNMYLFNSYGSGLLVRDTVDGVIDGNFISDAGPDGITCEHSTDIVITNNIVKECSDNGITSSEGDDGVIITNNTVYNIDNNDSPFALNNHCGIRIQGGSDHGGCLRSVVTNNYIHDSGSSGYGIYVGGGTAPDSSCTDIEVADNKIYNCPQGIWVNYTDIVDIHDNTIDTCSSRGINITDTVTEWTIEDNRIRNITNYGIHSDADLGMIKGNKLLSIVASAITCSGSDGVDICDNHIYQVTGPGNDGIGLSSTCTKCKVEDNWIRSVDGDGVWLAGSDDIFIDGNYIDTCGAYGINISNGTCDRTVVGEDNVLMNCTTALINDAGTGTKLPEREWLCTYGAGGISVTGDVPLAVITNGQSAAVGFEAPPKLQQLVRAYLKVLPNATQAAADWDLNSDYGDVGEGPATHSETDAATTYNVTNAIWYDIELVALGFFANIAAGDRGGIRLTVSTAGHDASVFSLRFEYV